MTTYYPKAGTSARIIVDWLSHRPNGVFTAKDLMAVGTIPRDTNVSKVMEPLVAHGYVHRYAVAGSKAYCYSFYAQADLEPRPIRTGPKPTPRKLRAPKPRVTKMRQTRTQAKAEDLPRVEIFPGVFA